jgi:hypothetical protein
MSLFGGARSYKQVFSFIKEVMITCSDARITGTKFKPHV